MEKTKRRVTKKIKEKPKKQVKQRTKVIGPNELVDSIGSEEFVNTLTGENQEKLRESIWARSEFDTPYAVSNQERFVGAPGKFTLLRKHFAPYLSN